MTELRHAWEKVVLNLEVQVCHHPVDDGTWRNVCGVIRGVFDPMKVLVGLSNREVRV